MAVTSAMFVSSNCRNQSANINQLTPRLGNIASQGKGSLLDGGVPVQSALTLTSGYTQKTSGHSANILSQHSAKLFAQSSAKVSAGQSAKFYAGFKYETLTYPDTPNRGEITPFKGFIEVTARGEIEYCQLINDRRVEFSESIKKGSISATRFVQPFGSMPLRRNSARANSLNQLPKLIFSPPETSFSCWRKSGLMRIWKVGDNPSPFGDLSLLTVDMYVRNLLICSLLRTYINMCYVIKAMPCGASTLTGHLTTSDTETIEVAMSQYITPVTGRNSLTPSQSFRWLFLALERGNPAARPHRIEATAPNEHSARLLLVRDYILAFAGRLPVREVIA